MSRPRKQAYRSTQMSELTRQMLYAPPARRAEVVRHAEAFHDVIEPTKNYPIDFVVYRLTDRRVPQTDSVMLVGEALRPDLRLMIDALSRSIELLPQEGDPGETTAELAERLGVSTKTIGRWRDAGLRWRWGVREAGGKPVVLITRSALKAFKAQSPRRVEAASRFTQMSEAEKRRLITRARRLANAVEVSAQAVLRHLSRRTGRSVEALRLMIGEHDKAHPESAVFADRAGPLTEDQKREIDQAYMAGMTVSAMCERFRKTRSTIYRAIHVARAARACALPIAVVYSPTFDRADADEVLMQPIKRKGGKPRKLGPEALKGLPPAVAAVYDRPIDSDAVTRSLIVRYNFIKHKAAAVQEELRRETVRAADIDRLDDLLRRAEAVRGQIIAGMLPVVLSVVRRQVAGGDQPMQGELLAMLDAGNAVLIEELERFDAARSHTFESVLTNRLLRVLASKQAGVVLAVSADELLARLNAE